MVILFLRFSSFTVMSDEVIRGMGLVLASSAACAAAFSEADTVSAVVAVGRFRISGGRGLDMISWGESSLTSTDSRVRLLVPPRFKVFDRGFSPFLENSSSSDGSPELVPADRPSEVTGELELFVALGKTLSSSRHLVVIN